MPVTCLLSHTYHDLRCPVCGEGFLILADMDSIVSRITVKKRLAETLRAHHHTVGCTNVHPAEAFDLPAEDRSLIEWPHVVDAIQTRDAAIAA